jgi:hypothetical protein
VKDAYGETPYATGLKHKIPSYYIRLILRSSPSLNPPHLKELNYQARKIALNIAFRTKKILNANSSWERFRSKDGRDDLIRHIISFL